MGSALSFLMDLTPQTDYAATAVAGPGILPSETPARRPARRSLLRLRGRVAYWHRVDGEPGSWGVLKSDGKIKFHVHISELRNSNRPPAIGQRVEFTPKLPRARGELRRAVDVFIEREVPVN